MTTNESIKLLVNADECFYFKQCQHMSIYLHVYQNSMLYTYNNIPFKAIHFIKDKRIGHAKD